MNLNLLHEIAPSIKFKKMENGKISCDEGYYKLIIQLYILNKWETLNKFTPVNELWTILLSPPLDNGLFFNDSGELINEPSFLTKLKQREKYFVLANESRVPSQFFILVCCLLLYSLFSIFVKYKRPVDLLQDLIAQAFSAD